MGVNLGDYKFTLFSRDYLEDLSKENPVILLNLLEFIFLYLLLLRIVGFLHTISSLMIDPTFNTQQTIYMCLIIERFIQLIHVPISVSNWDIIVPHFKILILL